MTPNLLPDPASLGPVLARARWYPYAVLTRYPHLLPAEQHLLTRWIQHDPQFALAACYDCHLGTPWPLPAGADRQLRQIAATLTQLRADAILWRPPALWILEIKPVLSPGALGQALVYSSLVLTQARPQIPVMPSVLTSWIHPALADAADALAVALLAPPEPTG